MTRSIKIGSCVYDGSSDFQFNIEIDSKYIWLNSGAVMIPPEKWDQLKKDIDVGLDAYRLISHCDELPEAKITTDT